MKRNEREFLLDFILLGLFIILALYNLKLENLGWMIGWFVAAGLRLILLVLNQRKWHNIYKAEDERRKELANQNKEDEQ